MFEGVSKAPTPPEGLSARSGGVSIFSHNRLNALAIDQEVLLLLLKLLVTVWS
jgi:hypothetical protein